MCAKFIAFFLLMVLLADAALGDLLSGLQPPDSTATSLNTTTQNVTNSTGTVPVVSPSGGTQDPSPLDLLINSFCHVIEQIVAQLAGSNVANPNTFVQIIIAKLQLLLKSIQDSQSALTVLPSSVCSFFKDILESGEYDTVFGDRCPDEDCDCED